MKVGIVGSGLVVVVVGGLDLALTRIPDATFMRAGALRALGLGANAVGPVLAATFMVLAGPREPQGPALGILFAAAVVAQWRRTAALG